MFLKRPPGDTNRIPVPVCMMTGFGEPLAWWNWGYGTINVIDLGCSTNGGTLQGLVCRMVCGIGFEDFDTEGFSFSGPLNTIYIYIYIRT